MKTKIINDIIGYKSFKGIPNALNPNSAGLLKLLELGGGVILHLL